MLEAWCSIRAKNLKEDDKIIAWFVMNGRLQPYKGTTVSFDNGTWKVKWNASVGNQRLHASDDPWLFAKEVL